MTGTCPRGVSRRGLLGGALGAAVAAPLVGSASSALAADEAPSAFPFEGRHQQGILTPAQEAACYVALDVTTTDRAELIGALKTLTSTARFLRRSFPLRSPGCLGMRRSSISTPK